MKNLCITSVAEDGKIAVTLGIALKLKKEGYRVAYFKPVGNQQKLISGKDYDALLMCNVLNLKTDINKIVHFITGASYMSGFKNKKTVVEKIYKTFDEISRDADIVIIDGASSPYAGAAYGLDVANLAGKFNASILNIIKFVNDLSVDQAIFLNKGFVLMGLDVIGHIFNNVPRQLLSKTEGVFKNILEEMGCKTLGVIPLRPEFASPSVADFYEVLGGEILTGEDKLDMPVEDVIIGAMTLESALQYMRRSANKAVIIGGDRADLALASLETSTSVLILTGGLYPDVKVISRAAEKGIPVILVHDNTYSTIERLSEVSRNIRPGDSAIINMAIENIEQYCDWELILDSLKK